MLFLSPLLPVVEGETQHIPRGNFKLSKGLAGGGVRALQVQYIATASSSNMALVTNTENSMQYNHAYTKMFMNVLQYTEIVVSHHTETSATRKLVCPRQRTTCHIGRHPPVYK